jgi:formylglycine-generating enzyme required for sulfatase activity
MAVVKLSKSTTAAYPGRPPHKNMVWVPGGTFLMGSNDFYPEERPVHRVFVDGFWMDKHTITNAQFRRFVKSTGHITVAERPPDPADYPGAQPKMLVPGSRSDKLTSAVCSSFSSLLSENLRQSDHFTPVRSLGG